MGQKKKEGHTVLEQHWVNNVNNDFIFLLSFAINTVLICTVPLTSSLAIDLTLSTENVKVPVSSKVRLEMVRLCTRPFAVIRKRLLFLRTCPSFCHTPSTLLCDSSTSKEAVSRSKVWISVRSFRILIFRAVWEAKVIKGESIVQWWCN